MLIWEISARLPLKNNLKENRGERYKGNTTWLKIIKWLIE